MVKNRILRTAMTCFAKYGIKAVSMDMIASELGISKKTLYVEFENKQQLLSESIAQELANLSISMRSIQAQSASPVETIVLISSNIIYHQSKYCSAYYREVVRYYEANEKLSQYNKIFMEQCTSLLQKGADEGYFMQNENYAAIATVFIEQLSSIESAYQSIAMPIFIRGICTDKGREELKRLFPKLNKTVFQTPIKR